MTDTQSYKVTLLRPTTGSDVVRERLAGLYDGVHRVIACDVRDSPSARIDPDGRYGAEPGTKIGEWVLGEADEVQRFLEDRGYEDYDVMDEIGVDLDLITGLVPERFNDGGLTHLVTHRYPSADADKGHLVGWQVLRAGYMDTDRHLGALYLTREHRWQAVDRRWEVSGEFDDVEEALRKIGGVDRPVEEVRVRMDVSVYVDPAAWQLAYGEMSRAGLIEDVATYVRTLLAECSQRPADEGGEGGFKDVTLRLA